MEVVCAACCRIDNLILRLGNLGVLNLRTILPNISYCKHKFFHRRKLVRETNHVIVRFCSLPKVLLKSHVDKLPLFTSEFRSTNNGWWPLFLCCEDSCSDAVFVERNRRLCFMQLEDFLLLESMLPRWVWRCLVRSQAPLFYVWWRSEVNCVDFWVGKNSLALFHTESPQHWEDLLARYEARSEETSMICFAAFISLCELRVDHFAAVEECQSWCFISMTFESAVIV